MIRKACFLVLLVFLAACTPAPQSQPSEQSFDISITERSLDPGQIVVSQGDTVTLRVSTDEAGEFHLAGYELIEDMDVEGVTEVTFVADAAGKYNIELHPAPHMSHEPYTVPEGETAPGLEIEVHDDPKAGWNIELKTTNFAFSPEGASLEHVAGEGHAHIYVDDVKVNRVYNNWYHIAKLSPGEHEIRVTLNTNDHRDYQAGDALVEASTTVTVPGETHSEEHTGHHDEEESHGHEAEETHAHDMLDVSGDDAPTVGVVVHEDPKAGWNIEIQTTNFAFSPEGASLEHVAGEGHAHIYVDDEKVNRVYGNWYHIAKLETGEHELRVTLNANSHEDLAVDGEMVAATTTITVAGEASEDDHHEAEDHHEEADHEDSHDDHDEGHGHGHDEEHEDILIGSLIVNPR